MIIKPEHQPNGYHPQTPKLSVAIVGGGIGGLCLAIGLLNLRSIHDIDIQIYEAAGAFAEIGAGVTIGPNASRALALLSKDAKRAFDSQAVGNGPSFPELKNVFTRILWGAGPRSGEWIADSWCDNGQQNVHRARFLDALIKLVPKDVAHFNKRLVRLEEGELEGDDGGEGRKATLYFSDHTSATADCVIGVDGIHSQVRKHLIPPSHPAYNPSFSGAAAYRGLFPTEDVLPLLGEELTQIATLHCGPGGAIMTYPTDSHNLFNIVACDLDVQHWSGDLVQPADLAKMKAKYKDWGPTVQKIVNLLDRPDTKIWSLWQMGPMSTFTRGRIAIMGDAAHATTPFHGQGAGQAIEDALVLSNLLARVQNVQDLELALQAYDRVRRPRAQKVVKTSREAGDLFSLRLEGVMDDEAKFRANIEDRYDWVFNRDMQLQVNQAIMMVEEMKMAREKGRRNIQVCGQVRD